jgi:periplasmic protein TonB
MSRSVSPSDRLTGTIILSLIGYGVLVLGIGFTLNKAASVRPTLDVILSPTSSSKAPKQADFLAQADNQGGGDSDSAQRPTDDQISQLPQTDPGDAPIALQAQKTAPEPDAVQRTVITRAPSTANVERAREQKPNTPDALPEGEELIERSLELARLANEYSRKQALQARSTEHKYITASTREYAYAQYMNQWVRKVERVGNVNYPQNALRAGIDGRLILTVAIRRDGRIEDITLVKSSGNAELDRAATAIVKLAEPFAALPSTKDNPSLLYITREWQFSAGQTSLN